MESPTTLPKGQDLEDYNRKRIEIQKRIDELELEKNDLSTCLKRRKEILKKRRTSDRYA